MGMTEAVLILFIICTVGQYLVKWGAYFERKFTIVSKLNCNWLLYIEQQKI